MHIHSVRDSPQAKLNNEINALFLLNEHGDLYFLLNDSGVHAIHFNAKRIQYRKENKIDGSVHKNVTLGCKL